MASEAGKGSKQRPGDIDAYSKNWEMIFGKKKQDTEKPNENKNGQPVKTGNS